MPYTDFGDDFGSPTQKNSALTLQQYIQQQQSTGPHLLEIPKASPFHLSDWVGGILDRADQLQQQAQQNEKDRNRFKSPVLPQFQSPLLNSIDQQIESKPTNNFTDIVKQQAPKQFPNQPASMQLPDAGEIQQQQGGATNPTFQWALSPQGQDFLTSGGAEKFNFGEFAKNPLQYLTQNNNMREFQWGTSPDTRQTLLNRGVPESTLNDLHQYLSTPEGGGKAKPINAAAAGPVESVVGSATKSGVLGGMLGGALPFVNAPLAAVDMALSSENGTGVSPQELAGTALQLGIGKATGPLSEAVASKAATGGLKGTIANLLARAGVDATANAGLTAGQITAAGQNPTSPESLKAIGESAAIGGVAGAGIAGVGGVSNALTQIPEQLKTPAKVAGTSAVTYAAARAGGMSNQDALALSAAIASGYAGARLSELAARGALPEWLASPIRSGFGSAIEFTDDAGKPVSMSDIVNTVKSSKVKIRYNADGEALAIVPGVRERLVVGKRGETVSELKSRAMGALKAGADSELEVRPGTTEGPLPQSIYNNVNGTTYNLRATADDGTALYAGKPGSSEIGQNHYVIRYPDGTLENHTTLGVGETSSNAPRIPKAPPGGGEWTNVSNGGTLTSRFAPREATPLPAEQVVQPQEISPNQPVKGDGVRAAINPDSDLYRENSVVPEGYERTTAKLNPDAKVGKDNVPLMRLIAKGNGIELRKGLTPQSMYKILLAESEKRGGLDTPYVHKVETALPPEPTPSTAVAQVPPSPAEASNSAAVDKTHSMADIEQQKNTSSQLFPRPPDDYKIGDWAVDDKTGQMWQLQEHDPNKVRVSGNVSNDVIRNAEAERYAEWAKGGSRLPAAIGLELPDGTIRVMDGQRRVEAAKRAGQPIRVWVEPFAKRLEEDPNLSGAAAPSPPAPQQPIQNDYTAAQKAIDDFEDALVAKYGQRAVDAAPTHDLGFPQAETLNAPDSAELKRLYAVRDRIGDMEDSQALEGALGGLPKEAQGPVPPDQVRRIVQGIQQQVNLANTFGHPQPYPDRESLLRVVYGLLSHKSDLPDAFRGDFEFALQEANNPHSVFGMSPAPVLRQAEAIVDGILSPSSDRMPTNATPEMTGLNQPATAPLQAKIPLGGANEGVAAFDKALAETPAPEPSFQYKVSNPPGQRPWALEDETPQAQGNIRANQAARTAVFGDLKPQRGAVKEAPQADILGPVPDTPPAETGAVSGAPTQDIFTMTDSKPDYGIPSESQVKQTAALFDEYGDIANQYASSKRLVSRATGPVGRMVDPASKYKLPEEQSAFKSAVAAANLEEALPDSVFQRIQPLKPLIGDGIRRALLKGGLEAAIPAASVLAYISTDGTLPDWLREAIIVGGFGTSGILSDTYRRGFLAEKPWMKVTRKATSTLDTSLAKLIDSDPNKRFFDIMENPNDYNLSPAQLKSAQAFRDLRDARLVGDNAARVASGLSPIKYRMNNAIGHYYDIASLGEAGIQMALPKEFTRSEVPGVLRRQGLERERVLGGTWRQVWAEHPEIKPLGDVTQLLAMELQQSTAVRARSALLYGLKKDGLAETFPSTDGLPKEQKLAADKAIADRRAQLMNAGWEAIPGLDGSLMHPSAARVVKDLFQSSHTTGSLHTFIDTADKATQVVRAAMFSMDLSAWTLQGAQLFMQSPVSMLTHIVPLMRGTFSEDFYQRYKAGKFAAGESGGKFGANIGREFHGIEDKNLPEVIRKVENAGFGRFLPMARQIIFEQNKNVESLLERLPGGKLPVIGDAARLAELIPPATYAAYQVKNGDEIDPTTMAIMIGIGGGIDLARGYLGKTLADGLSKEGAIKAGVRAAKGTNRIGGVLNRAGMGIGAQQSKLERTFLFRSPAMTRNALELTGLALLNPGAEGQFARAYLVKSAFAYTAILASAKLAATGQMDSFDPSDPNSILSVQNLGRLQIPGLSTVSPSSPLLSMARAMLYQDRPDDERAWEASRMNPLTSDFWHDKGLGISDWLTGRTPDIVGAGTNAIIQGGITNLTGDRIRQPGTSPDVNLTGALGDAASHFLPLSAQSALTTGLAQKTALGKALGDVMGIQPNPAYDSLRKQITGVGATLGGLNVQPEYPGATLARLRDEQAAKITNGNTTDYFSLDNAQRKQVRDALAGNAEYEKALKAVQGSGADSESPTDQYFADRDSVTQTYAKNLNDAAQQVLDGKQTKEWFKGVVKLQNGNRSAALDQIDATYSKISANRPGTKESVLDYLKRNEQPVDKAVDGWYDLFNQATGPDGLDFDKLDKLQKFYMLTLSPAARSYVKQQTASTSNPVNSLVAEYDQAKKDTSEFWTLQDRVFAGAKQNLPFFQNFNTLDDFNKFLQDGSTALGGALSPSDLSTLIGRAVPQVKQYLDQVSYWEKKWRLTHPEGDRALVQWYGFSPADKIDYTGRLTGVAQVPESRSVALLNGTGKNSAAQTLPTILQFLMESGNGDVMNMPVIRLALQGSYNTKK